MENETQRKPTHFYHDAVDHSNATCQRCFWKHPDFKQARSTYMRESKRGYDGDISIYRTDEATEGNGEIQVQCNTCGLKSLDYEED